MQIPLFNTNVIVQLLHHSQYGIEGNVLWADPTLHVFVAAGQQKLKCDRM